MLIVALLLFQPTRIDTLDLRGAFQVAARQAFVDAEKSSAATRDAHVVYIDVASFRIAAGLDSATVPSEWNEIADVLGSRGRVARAAQVLHCSGVADRRSCVSPATGVALIKVTAVHRNPASLEVDVSVRAGQHSRVYAEIFGRHGEIFEFQSSTLLMIGTARD